MMDPREDQDAEFLRTAHSSYERFLSPDPSKDELLLAKRAFLAGARCGLQYAMIKVEEREKLREQVAKLKARGYQAELTQPKHEHEAGMDPDALLEPHKHALTRQFTAA